MLGISQHSTIAITFSWNVQYGECVNGAGDGIAMGDDIARHVYKISYIEASFYSGMTWTSEIEIALTLHTVAQLNATAFYTTNSYVMHSLSCTLHMYVHVYDTVTL